MIYWSHGEPWLSVYPDGISLIAVIHLLTIGLMGNTFADYFKPIARYNSERGIWYVYDGSVWRADSENLRVAELAKLLADKLYLFALEIKEEDARKRFIERVKKLQLRPAMKSQGVNLK